MLCKLLLFALLVSVYGGGRKQDPVISEGVRSEPKSAGELGLSDVSEAALAKIPFVIGGRSPKFPPWYPRPPCPQPAIPLYPPRFVKIIEVSDSDGKYDLIKECQTGCWVQLDNLRVSCKEVPDELANKEYAKCMKGCLNSRGSHHDIELWQALLPY